MPFPFELCLYYHPPRPKTLSVAYKYVTSMLKDRLAVETRSSREVRKTYLHWPDSRSQLWSGFMSTFCMRMYTESHNLFAARRLGSEWNQCGRSRRCNVISSEELVQLAPTQCNYLVHARRPVIPVGQTLSLRKLKLFITFTRVKEISLSVSTPAGLDL